MLSFRELGGIGQTEITWSRCLFLLVFSLKNLVLVHIPKVQTAPELGDSGHKISHELRCSSPQATEGLHDEWFTAVLTIAYSLSSEKWNLALAKKKSNCISTSSFNIFKLFFHSCWKLDVLRIGLKTRLKKEHANTFAHHEQLLRYFHGFISCLFPHRKHSEKSF